MSEFPIDDLIKEVIETFQFTTESHSVIRKGEAEKTIVGDKDRLGQVLINLIANAIKFSPQAKEVTVNVFADKDSVSISVQDFGIGVSQEEQKKIFEPFYRVKGMHGEQFAGLGLGLHIATDIVTRHHGTIRVESKKGKGTTFYVTLPLKYEENSE